MSRFLYSGGKRTFSCNAIDSRYVAFPGSGVRREPPTATFAAAKHALDRLCPSKEARRRLALLTVEENEALALTEIDRLTVSEAARNMGVTVDYFESLLLGAWLRLEHD